MLCSQAVEKGLLPFSRLGPSCLLPAGPPNCARSCEVPPHKSCSGTNQFETVSNPHTKNDSIPSVRRTDSSDAATLKYGRAEGFDSISGETRLHTLMDREITCIMNSGSSCQRRSGEDHASPRRCEASERQRCLGEDSDVANAGYRSSERANERANEGANEGTSRESLETRGDGKQNDSSSRSNDDPNGRDCGKDDDDPVRKYFGDEDTGSCITSTSWVLHQPIGRDYGNNPGPRAGHALIFHSGSIFMFGGLVDGVGENMDIVSSRGLQNQPGIGVLSGAIASSHASATLALDTAEEDISAVPAAARQVVRWRGTHTNSIHQYDLGTKLWTCLSFHVENDQRFPKPRRHAAVVAHGGSLLVYGGFDAYDAVLGDLWEFQLQNCKWSRIMYTARGRALHASGITNVAPNLPHQVAGHANNPFSGGDEMHLSVMPVIHNRSQAPGPRAEHTAVTYGNAMVVFGGYDGKKKLNDTYVFDFASKDWSRVTAAELNAPSRRCKHSAVIYNKKMYVMGGFQIVDGSNYAVTDIHALDLDTFTWTPYVACTNAPDALQGHKAIVVGDSMYVVGGKVRGQLSDVMKGTASGLLTEVLRFQFDANRWSVVEVVGNRPSPRQLHAAVAVPKDDIRDSIFVFGGCDKGKHNYLDDMWELRDIKKSPETSETHFCSNCMSTRVLVNNPMFSDVRFLVENHVIHAHRCVLYCRAKYFRNMFETGMRESTQKEISIPDLSYSVFLSVLEYLYTGYIEFKSGRAALDILVAADMFGLDILRAKCMERVESAVTVTNAAFICEVADSHNAYALKQYCVSFILHNFKDVINTEAWADLQRRDSPGLGREILNAFTDSAQFDPSRTRKRPRMSIFP